MGVGFFGLQPQHRQIIHSTLFDLIYHGNGGFTWSDVYNMPTWARKFYISKIIEFNQEKQKAEQKEHNKIKSKMRR